jgi:hypothetical protein
MRTIKFRAWDKNREMMINQDLSSLYTNAENYTLLQFTGLIDKNGKDIYEGDILTHAFEKVIEVIFWKGSFCSKRPTGVGLELSRFDYPETFEVIGNIYEDPELINK